MITRRPHSTDGPTWFDGCFSDEPPDVSPLQVLELAKTSVRRRRLIGAAATFAMLTVLALVAGLTASSALPLVRVRTAVPSPAPFLGSSAPDLVPTPPTPSSTTSPGIGSPSKLTWTSGEGYKDINGLLPEAHEGEPFGLTVQHMDALIQRRIDPRHEHLTEAGGSLGTSYSHEVEAGKAYTWKNAGEPGEGSVEVEVTRLAPGTKVNLKHWADAEVGQCGYIDEDCRMRTIGGVQVQIAQIGEDGFALDLIQRDGEIGSIKVLKQSEDSDSALASSPLSVEQAIQLLQDEQLDVVG